MGEQPTTSPSDPPSSQTAAEPPRYCRGCNYNLHGLTASRCPECGREFDPTNRKTYLSRPPRVWVRYVRRAAYALAAILMILAAVWSWFFWGWRSEQESLVALKIAPEDAGYVRYATLFTSSPQEQPKGVGYVLDRVRFINLNSRPDLSDISPLARLSTVRTLDLGYTSVSDITPLAKLTHLEKLALNSTPVKNLAPLVGLTKLQKLALNTTPVNDVTPLAGLSDLQELGLSTTRVTDLTPLAHLRSLRLLDLRNAPVENVAPLAGLTELQTLGLGNTRITSIAPLKGLTKIERLFLEHTPITDITPLTSLKSLHELRLPAETITESQADSLQRDLPSCKITRE